jgi:hypothetical protein
MLLDQVGAQRARPYYANYVGRIFAGLESPSDCGCRTVKIYFVSSTDTCDPTARRPMVKSHSSGSRSAISRDMSAGTAKLRRNRNLYANLMSPAGATARLSKPPWLLSRCLPAPKQASIKNQEMVDFVGAPDTIRTCDLCLRRAAQKVTVGPDRDVARRGLSGSVSTQHRICA